MSVSNIDVESSLVQPLTTSEKRVGIKAIPFIAIHLTCLAAIATGFSLPAVGLCIGLYAVRMWALTAGYHRYFSHRTYKTSRAFQFVLAVIGTMAAQKGPLWWAAHHRRHHRYTDQEGDVHSPRRQGFWWAHVGWVVSDRYDATDWEAIRDFGRFGELRWINKWHLVPPAALAAGCYLLLGWQGVIWGFFVSTVLLYHCTFSINSLAHIWGSRRYKTTDDSRNNFLLALLTGGEGWHNNHHHYMSTVKQGFFWWEVDLSYYALKVLSWLRIVWDLRQPPRLLLTRADS
jgi:stearoyl-CoA desaturase (delta-9 desaturase)